MAPILFFLFLVFVFAQDWKETYAAAVEYSLEENTPSFLVFEGSNTYTPSIILDKLIWKSEELKGYAKENHMLYKADFLRKKNQSSENLTKQQATLANRFKPNGHFPLVLVLNSDEIASGRMGYKNGAHEDYSSLLNNGLN